MLEGPGACSPGKILIKTVRSGESGRSKVCDYFPINEHF